MVTAILVNVVTCCNLITFLVNVVTCCNLIDRIKYKKRSFACSQGHAEWVIHFCQEGWWLLYRHRAGGLVRYNLGGFIWIGVGARKVIIRMWECNFATL